MVLADDEHGDRPNEYRVSVLCPDREDVLLVSCGSPNPHDLAAMKLT